MTRPGVKTRSLHKRHLPSLLRQAGSGGEPGSREWLALACWHFLNVLIVAHFVEAKLGRSRSSPSPPGPDAAGSARRASRAARRRLPSGSKPQRNPALDWSTSYQAGESRYAPTFCLGKRVNVLTHLRWPFSSQSGECSSSENDDDLHSLQLRRSSSNGSVTISAQNGSSSPKPQLGSPHICSSPSASPKLTASQAPVISRSRSPVVKALSAAQHISRRRVISPSAPVRNKMHTHNHTYQYLLPSTFCISLPSPWGRQTWKVSGDLRKAGENIILLVSLIFGIKKIWADSDYNTNWIALGTHNLT